MAAAAASMSGVFLFPQPPRPKSKPLRAAQSLSFPNPRHHTFKDGSRFPATAMSAETATSYVGGDTEKPMIELEFVDPKVGGDGKYGRTTVMAVSGEKLMRNVMIDNKIELYAPYGKVMNCGGGGSCGTCIVEIIDGQDLLNERTNTEKRYLKKKLESWRLACQTILGNKENSGKVTVQRLPQWKK